MTGITAAPWPLTGRDAELGTLAAAIGPPGCGGVLLTGVAGSGLSRLAEEGAAIGAAAGLPVDRVVATRSTAGIPLGALAALLPDTPTAGPAEPAADLLAWAVRAIGAAGPRLLVVDDAEHLDAVSAVVLQRLVEDGTTLALLTVHRGEQAPDPVRCLWKDGTVERIDVEPLTRPDVDTLLDTVLGGWIDGAARRDLWDLSSGRPLVLRELLLAGLQTGALSNEAGLWQFGDGWEKSPRLIELGLEIPCIVADSNGRRHRQAAVAAIEGLTGLGRLSEAAAVAAVCYDAAVEAHDGTAQSWFALQRGRVALLRGRLGEAAGWFREGAATAAGSGPAWQCRSALLIATAQAGKADASTGGSVSLAARAWLAQAEARTDEARDLLAAAARAAEDAGELTAAVGAWHDLARLGEADRAARALARLVDVLPGELTAACRDHAEGLRCADPVLLAEVAGRFETLGADLYAAEAAAAAAAAYQRDNDSRAASRLARLAHSLADGCDAATPALRLAGPAGALTGREHEIAELAAQGLTSKAIANRFRIGVRTVESHLQRAYTKLGVRCRAELAAALTAA